MFKCKQVQISSEVSEYCKSGTLSIVANSVYFVNTQQLYTQLEYKKVFRKTLYIYILYIYIYLFKSSR